MNPKTKKKEYPANAKKEEFQIVNFTMTSSSGFGGLFRTSYKSCLDYSNKVRNSTDKKYEGWKKCQETPYVLKEDETTPV